MCLSFEFSYSSKSLTDLTSVKLSPHGNVWIPWLRSDSEDSSNDCWEQPVCVDGISVFVSCKVLQNKTKMIHLATEWIDILGVNIFTVVSSNMREFSLQKSTWLDDNKIVCRTLLRNTDIISITWRPWEANLSRCVIPWMVLRMTTNLTVVIRKKEKENKQSWFHWLSNLDTTFLKCFWHSPCNCYIYSRL